MKTKNVRSRVGNLLGPKVAIAFVPRISPRVPSPKKTSRRYLARVPLDDVGLAQMKTYTSIQEVEDDRSAKYNRFSILDRITPSGATT